MKAKKLSKVILSFALSAALLIEPIASMPIVYAEEPLTSDWTAEDQNDDGIETADQEDADQNETDDADGGGIESETEENDGTESGSGEEDKDKEDESGSGEEDKDKEDESASGEEDKDKEDGSESGDNVGEDDENSDEENGEQLEEEKTDEAEDENPEALDEEDELDGFSKMPEGYELTESQKIAKSELADILSQIDESDEGYTYAERRVFTFADSLETAEMIAEAYHAEIMSFDMGVLVLKLSEGKTVKEALAVAADLDNNLPAVWPDYKRELYGEAPLGTSENDVSELEIVEEEYTLDDADIIAEPDDDAIPSDEEYEQVLNELSGFTDDYLKPTDPCYQWFHTTIGSAYAWDAGYLGEHIRVGVVDSGVAQNTDLNSNVEERKDFSNDTSGELDSMGHGTHVAGIIAAAANGSQGVGVAPKAKIYSARVFGNDKTKSGYDSTIMRAINYLIGEDENADPYSSISNTPAKVDIINMSLGGPGKNSAFQKVLDKAYQKGVVVFAAMGNDGGSLMQYPASYDHVIAVAATDTNNQRAYFSNYGSATDLSAPGVNIYSTVPDGYDSMQGTSMACPVAAGEAAVILSVAVSDNDKDKLPTLKDKTGSERVDALEAIMKANTISAGSGMGKGITSLPKVFKLSTAAAKPNAPEITPSVAANKQSVEIKIKVQSGMSLCYTTNGKNPVYKDGTPDANTIYIPSATLKKQNNEETLSFNYNDITSAKGTVKAFAINASGVIGPVKSVSYTLQPYVREITVSGPSRVVQGKSIQLAVAVAPSYATNKKVDWMIVDNDNKPITDGTIKVSASGKVTTTAKAVPGEYQVLVTAQDANKKSVSFKINVISANDAIQSLAFKNNTNKELWITKTAPSQDLAQYLVAKMKNAEGALEDKSGEGLNGLVLWTSSKPAVAVVDSNGKITAKSAGTTTITAKANDSGNKKASISITVKQAVTDITITTDKGKTDQGLFVVAAGKSMTLKAVVNDGKPKPTNSKVVWDINPKDDKNVTINNSTGKITVKAGASAGSYTVIATAADNQGVSATRTIQVCDGAIGGFTLDATKKTLYTKNVDATKTNTATIQAKISGEKGSIAFNKDAYTVTSSNESIVKVSSSSPQPGVVDITITAAGGMYGKANVVIASTDGGNKKATCVVDVKGGITKVEMKDAKGNKVSKLTMFRKGTAATSHQVEELNAVITSSEGANMDAYKVTSSNPKLVSASLNKETKKITLQTGSNFTGKATITLESTDGSKKKATCTVTVCNPPSRINIAPKAGETGSVVPGKSVQLVATMETEDGAVSNKNVTWRFADEDAAAMANLGVKINAASGKITVPKSIKRNGKTYKLDDMLLDMGGAGYVEVCAEAKDGSGVAATGQVWLARATTTIRIISSYQDPETYAVYYFFESDCFLGVTCSSSSPKVASPTVEYTRPSVKTDSQGNPYVVMGQGLLAFEPNNKGTTTFTIKALDGSGKSAKTSIRIR